jgi:hypothetical protein
VPASTRSSLDSEPRMKYSPTYKVVCMVGPRNGQNFFWRLTLWSWASRSYGEVASPSEAWREADMAACAAVSLSLPGQHRSSQLYHNKQRHSHDRPSLRQESQPRSAVLIKTISRQKCQHCSAACESPRTYSMTVHPNLGVPVSVRTMRVNRRARMRIPAS